MIRQLQEIRSTPLLVVIILLCVLPPVTYLLVWRRRVPKGLRELPGPKGYPIVGNMFEMPKSHFWVKFKELGDIYGPIFKLEIFGETHVVISKAEIAEELLAKRGAYYSDRGKLPMIDLMTRNQDLLAVSNNDYWRRGRKFASLMLTGSAASQWEPFQAHQALRMLVGMVETPSRYQYWFERYSTILSLRQGYGLSLQSAAEEEWHTAKILHRMHNVEIVAEPGKYLVNIIPWLSHLPEWMAPFKQEATRLYEDESSYFDSLLQTATKSFENGLPEEPASFARCWQQDKDHYQLSYEEIRYVIGTMYGGGAGTTSGVMKAFVQAMCLYPQWQTALQEEIDRVIGPDRVPGFSDQPNLPLVRATAKELLRWRPAVPGNQPHKVSKNDSYEGYHIPAGALIHGNQWAIHREEEIFPDPEQFNPGRWIDSSYPTYKTPLEQFPNLKRNTAFGFGRRICPGLEVAERSLFIQISTLAWACQFSLKKDAEGRHIPVPFYDMAHDAPIAPNDLVFDLKPREDRRIQRVRESLNMVS